MKYKILFVCKYNRFRSVIAEALFNKLNRNREIKARSAGIINGNTNDKNVEEVAKELRLKIKKRPDGLSSRLLKWQNIVVVVADDVPLSIFSSNKKYGKKIIGWKINDVHSENKKEIKEIIIKIDNKVKKFVRKMEK